MWWSDAEWSKVLDSASCGMCAHAGLVENELSPEIPIQYVFEDQQPPQLNRDWLEALSRASHGVRGVVVVNEVDAADIAHSDPTTRKTKLQFRKLSESA